MRVPNASLTFTRKQYLLRAAYTITVNKRPGQTVANAILDLSTDPFSHVQLYVALPRMKSSHFITIFAPPSDARGMTAYTRNVVDAELLGGPVLSKVSRGMVLRAVDQHQAASEVELDCSHKPTSGYAVEEVGRVSSESTRQQPGMSTEKKRRAEGI